MEVNREERLMTESVGEMIRRGLITIGTCVETGQIIPQLSPTGLAIGGLVSGLIRAITQNEMNWSQLVNALTWRELVNVVLEISGRYFVQNWDMLLRLALKLARYILSLFEQSSRRHRALPETSYNVPPRARQDS